MHPRETRGLLSCLSMSWLLLTGCAAQAAEVLSQKPNVILIVSDDHGYADVGFHGSTEIRTPALDRLAASGVVFTAGYVTHPLCSPSRAGFLSGRHGARFGHIENPGPKPSHFYPARGLPLSERTMADALKAQGYATGIIGKWHLGVEPQFHPNLRGFDYFFGFLPSGHHYWRWEPNTPGDPYTVPLLRNGQVVPGVEKEYLTDVLAREAVAFMEEHAGGGWGHNPVLSVSRLQRAPRPAGSLAQLPGPRAASNGTAPSLRRDAHRPR